MDCEARWSGCSADGLLGYQIDTDGFRFSGLLIDTNFEADGIALGDLIALAQCRYVEENVAATIVRFDETEALILVEHLNFAGWHAVPQFLITDPFLSAFAPASYHANRADDRDCRGRPLASLVLSACCLTRPISQKGPLLASGSFVQKEAAKSKIKADEIAGR
jgi:hypothetical protein